MATSKLFTAIVGNPPYQEQNNRTNNHNMPLYHYFYDLAEYLSTRYTLITPARFLFNAGSTPDKWNQYMLSNPHIRVLLYTEQTGKLFDTVDIKGGVVSLYFNTEWAGKPINIFIKDDLLASVLEKTQVNKVASIESGMYVQSKVNLERAYTDYPEIKPRRPKSHLNDNAFVSDAFVIFKELFSETKDSAHNIGIYGQSDTGRKMMYVSDKYILKDKTSAPLSLYKVIVPVSSGNGIFGETLSTPEIVGKHTGHTKSFRTLGAFKTKKEAEALLSYIKTKLFRALMGISKITQNIPPKVFRYVPTQDFTAHSDIDWSQSITNIDQQLYKKYNLALEEIDYIEQNVQPME